MRSSSNNVSAARLPYVRLVEEEAGAEVEMVGMDDDYGRERGKIPAGGPMDLEATRLSNGEVPSSPSLSASPRVGRSSLKTLTLASMMAAGVQFGWALQLSLLTPYIQTLGLGHAFSSLIWLCGPITGLVVQPCVGIWSDKCQSKYGRRRPFILLGSLLISFSVTIIGFSADIGFVLGDTSEQCSNYTGPRWWAAAVFVIGFWMLDLANNTVQGPARALLADLSGPNQTNHANAIFCSWMAFGNILGFSAGSSGKWHRWFPFLTTRACCEACANLKAAFLVAVVFLMFCTLITLLFAKEIPLVGKKTSAVSDSAPLLIESQQSFYGQSDTSDGMSDNGKRASVDMVDGKAVAENHSNRESSVKESNTEDLADGPSAVLVNLLTSLRHLPPGMHVVLVVMAFTWLSWFPFFLFDTDWMGRELYHGNPNGNITDIENYHQGVREGAFGLLLNSVVLLFSSFLVEPMCKQMNARAVWGISNFVIFACMAATVIISFLSQNTGINSAIKCMSLILFSILGFPLAITYSVPFSMTAELTAGTGGGQGLATGVLNLSIVVPQMIISLGAGPWDAIFGGGNIPAFVLASIFSVVGGVIAITKLPVVSYRSSGFHGFG